MAANHGLPFDYKRPNYFKVCTAAASPLPSPVKSPARTPMAPTKTPCCTALYDFEPENQGELGFKISQQRQRCKTSDAAIVSPYKWRGPRPQVDFYEQMKKRELVSRN